MNPVKLAVWLLLLSLLATDVRAGERGPGKHSGVVVFDRWDGCTLYSGIYVMYISERVKDKLRKHAGKSVQIDAIKVHQPKNPGDGLITEFTYLGPAPQTMNWVSLSGVELVATPSSTKGQPPTVIISVRNRGKRDVKVYSSHLAPTLLSKTSGGRTSLVADGPSYALITRQAFIGGSGPRTKGWGWSIDQGLPRTFTLAPGAERRIRITFDLPAGEYDFLAGYGGGVHGGKGIASNLVAFDVTKDGKANFPTIKGRKQSRSGEHK
ncbi:MAG: hypothetical protein IID44_12275 [Planctomycetes bacterium]|nr:hypothetical protein [Planctomycetota bacterium]